jgi:hypothetical protein
MCGAMTARSPELLGTQFYWLTNGKFFTQGTSFWIKPGCFNAELIFDSSLEVLLAGVCDD